jgi:hypothetical protein
MVWPRASSSRRNCASRLSSEGGSARRRAKKSRAARSRSTVALAWHGRRDDAERFIEDVRGDDPELASYLRIEERELEAGGRN